MAIRVGGTVVVDDSRNLSNTTTLTATTLNSTTVCGTTVCGTFCGSLGAISASNLTGIPASDQYICMVACEAITAGSPVSSCGTCGLIATKGGPPSYQLGAALGCQSGYNTNGAAGYFQNDSVALNFACCPNCFVTATFFGGGGSVGSGICQNIGPFACIRVHNVSSTGQISTACLCCFNYGPCNGGLCCVPCAVSGTPCCTVHWDIFGTGLVAMPSCSGATGGILVPIYKNSYDNCVNCYASSCLHNIEYFFCYCTTTCAISLLRHCHATGWAGGRYVTEVYPYLTNDRRFFVGIFNNYPSDLCLSGCCAEVCSGLYVKALTDSMCLLTWPEAVSCSGVAWKSVLPADSAKLNVGGYSNNLYPCNIMYGGTLPLTQGADGWTMNYYDTLSCCCCAAAAANCSCNWSCPKIWAFRAVADNCYSMSNIICPFTCTCIPYYVCSACNCCPSGTAVNSIVNPAMGSPGWDEANIKKLYFQGVCTDTCCITGCYSRVVCFCVTGTTLSYVSATDGYTMGACICKPKFGLNFYGPVEGVGCGVVAGGMGTCARQNTGVGLWNSQNATQWAIYVSSLPVCWPCSCYAFIGQQEILLGKEGCCAWLTVGGNHCIVYGCASNLNMCWYNRVWYYKPSLSTFIFQLTDCGGTGAQPSDQGLYAYSKYPFLNNSNTIITAASTNKITTRAACQCACSYTGLGSARLGYCDATVCNWLGIAQNSAAAGANVCIAVPGMVDRTSFSTALSSYVGACCLLMGFNCTGTTGTVLSGNQLTVGVTPCGLFCNYGTAILLNTVYDSAKGCYVTQIQTKSPYSGTNCGCGS